MYKIMANVGEGSHVVAFDYRGFGDSDRVRVSEKGVQQDALAAFNWVVSRGVAPSKVLLVGHSLGTGVATFLARNLTLSGVNPGGLVILSGYASIPDAALGYPMVPLLYPFRFVPWLAPHVKALIVERWESVKNVRDVRVPVLIIHGGSDFEILPWQARALFVESLGSRLGKQIVEPPADKASAFAANRDHSHILPYDGYHIRPLAGEEAWLWISDLGPLREEMGDVWYLEVKHAGHNTLSQFEVVADGLKEWAETHGL
ncbi:hypothetical protein HK104_007631 [Borealophlyctis nickersoniae]|nr:hypothetical protein HK104_007631 [Borealophlyctis nickersoniae]